MAARLLVMTVGKTHSGKTTFARALEGALPGSLVIDQDNHAEFINTHYPALVPASGPNTLKLAVTQAIVDYAVGQTSLHLINCGANRSPQGRARLLRHFKGLGFATALVYFDLPEALLKARIASAGRSRRVLRAAGDFGEVLARQQGEDARGEAPPPGPAEADHLFAVRHPDDTRAVLEAIVRIAEGRGAGAQ